MQAIRLKTEHLFDPVGVDFVAPPGFIGIAAAAGNRPPIKSLLPMTAAAPCGTAAKWKAPPCA